MCGTLWYAWHSMDGDEKNHGTGCEEHNQYLTIGMLMTIQYDITIVVKLCTFFYLTM
jgi:hypothetical protein